MFGLLILTLLSLGNAQDIEPCELGVFMQNRAGQPVTAFGPVYNIDTDACYTECVDSGCACTLEREGGCTLNGASDCDIHARCCWFRFWSDKTLNDINEDDELGRSWGQYMCDVSYDALAIPEDEIYALTMDMDGRWLHCGSTGAVGDWEVIDNGEQDVPSVVCCDQLHQYLDCEA